MCTFFMVTERGQYPYNFPCPEGHRVSNTAGYTTMRIFFRVMTPGQFPYNYLVPKDTKEVMQRATQP